MIELVFVIVVVGILAGIAIPRFAATRDDAFIAKARATVGAVRSALVTERQKRILRGDFNTTLTAPAAGNNRVFVINAGGTEQNLTEYGVRRCAAANSGSNCWWRSANDTFLFRGPNGTTCTFKINSRFQFVKQSGCTVPGFDDL
jgi:general secretion pathway protein G